MHNKTFLYLYPTRGSRLVNWLVIEQKGEPPGSPFCDFKGRYKIGDNYNCTSEGLGLYEYNKALK